MSCDDYIKNPGCDQIAENTTTPGSLYVSAGEGGWGMSIRGWPIKGPTCRGRGCARFRAGRLIMADALANGIETCKPQAVNDLVILTGAVIIGPGHHYIGLLSNNDHLAGQLIAAGLVLAGPCGVRRSVPNTANRSNPGWLISKTPAATGVAAPSPQPVISRKLSARPLGTRGQAMLC